MYKISCNDPSIQDIYVGHTTDFVIRKNGHKSKCLNENSPRHNVKLYKTIRDNGGWDNWSMLPIEEYPCENTIQARIRENQLIKELNSTLNCNIPTRDYKQYYEDTRDLFLEKSKTYRDNNKEKVAEYQKQYRQKNKEELSKKKLIWQKEHRQKLSSIKLKSNENVYASEKV
jgi:hypothetical protein